MRSLRPPCCSIFVPSALLGRFCSTREEKENQKSQSRSIRPTNNIAERLLERGAHPTARKLLIAWFNANHGDVIAAARIAKVRMLKHTTHARVVCLLLLLLYTRAAPSSDAARAGAERAPSWSPRSTARKRRSSTAPSTPAWHPL